MIFEFSSFSSTVMENQNMKESSFFKIAFLSSQLLIDSFGLCSNDDGNVLVTIENNKCLGVSRQRVHSNDYCFYYLLYDLLLLSYVAINCHLFSIFESLIFLNIQKLKLNKSIYMLLALINCPSPASLKITLSTAKK